MNSAESNSSDQSSDSLNLRWDSIPIWVVDFEGHSRYGVIEYGVACLMNGGIEYTSSRMCSAIDQIPIRETAVHGLKVSDVSRFPYFSEDFEVWVAMRNRGLFAAHNRVVEDGLLRKTWPRPSFVPTFLGEHSYTATWGPWIDTLVLMRHIYPQLNEYALSALVSTFGLGLELEELAQRHCAPERRRWHCALYDALASALLLVHIGRQPGFEQMPLSWLLEQSRSRAADNGKHQGELFADL
ncbi:MAG: 3'-5' exonuclease [Verrucomicrobia bacterium]|nr:3'-5' exonuclease [Verrucomicrobiota bacterium]